MNAARVLILIVCIQVRGRFMLRLSRKPLISKCHPSTAFSESIGSPFVCTVSTVVCGPSFKGFRCMYPSKRKGFCAPKGLSRTIKMPSIHSSVKWFSPKHRSTGGLKRRAWQAVNCCLNLPSCHFTAWPPPLYLAIAQPLPN
jgi:hypothetical protein